MQHWEDIAWRVQDDAEKVLLRARDWLRETTGAKNLVHRGRRRAQLRGQRADRARGRISTTSGFNRRPAMTASRSAAPITAIWRCRNKPRNYVMNHAYIGVAYKDEEVDGRRQQAAGASAGAAKRSENICAETAKLLSEGNVFGWFQGRSEFGPRALGNRSIIADPRTAEMKDKLNKRVKHRQAFRPFAPIVLAERRTRFSKATQESPFMLIAKNVRPRMAGPNPGHRPRRRHRPRPDGARAGRIRCSTGC